MRNISTLLIVLAACASATTYNIGPGKTYTTVGAAPWSSLAAGDVVNIYPQAAITGVTASSSTGTTITLVGSAGSIPYGSSVWFSGYTGTLTWATCGVWGSGLYGTATGGTACTGSAVTINDAVSVGSGVTVYFTPPYFERIVLTQAGAISQPITIQGVPDPTTGALPAFEAHNATTGPNMAHLGISSQHDAFGFFLLLKNSGGTAWPKYVKVSKLRIQGARSGLTFYDGANASVSYVSGVGGIRIENAENVTLDGNEIFDNMNGVFSKTDPDTNPAQFDKVLTVSRNHFYSNGNGSSFHQSYIEADGATYEYNWYDKSAPGCGCSQLKDRSRSTVIRYNQLYPSARGIDLVNSQNGFTQLIPMVQLTVPGGGFSSGATTLNFGVSVAGISPGDVVGYINASTGWGYPGGATPVMPAVATASGTVLTLATPFPATIAAGETLYVIARATNTYMQSFVYGNIFDWDQSLYPIQPGAIVHYGFDTAPGIDSVKDRAGTLYFYDNTVIVRWDLTGSTGSSFGNNLFQSESEADTIRADDNLFYVTNSNNPNTSTYLQVLGRAGYGGVGLQTVGIFTGGTNQIVSSAGVGSNTCASITKTGWAACGNAPSSGSSISLTGWATITKAQAFPSGLTGRDYHLQATSTAIGAASALPAAIASNTLGLDFTPTLEYGEVARPNVSDIGALHYAVVSPVPPTVTISSLASGTVGVSYSQTLTATGDTPITWSVVVGSLPSWASLNASTGAITGTPDAAATTSFTARATNGAGTNDKALSITIAAPLSGTGGGARGAIVRGGVVR